MATLTLSFRGTTQKVHRVDSGIITIGRDPDNTLCIDSLAIAPKHVIIDFDHSDGPKLILEDNQYPVLINGKSVDQHQLSHGDLISLGKHTLCYTTDDWDNKALEPPPDFPKPHKEAGLQILNGKNIGRVIPLKRAMTRLGNPGGSIAVIAARKNGFFLSSLEGGERIRVNGQPVGEQTIELTPGDRLEINDNKLLFYV